MNTVELIHNEKKTAYKIPENFSEMSQSQLVLAAGKLLGLKNNSFLSEFTVIVENRKNKHKK